MRETLGQKQRRFSVAIAKLILAATEMGYEVTLGDAYRDPRLHGTLGEKKGYGHANSMHKSRLAVDLNLFKDGKFLTDGASHSPLHDIWDDFGGAKRIPWDMNHYSFEHEGMR